ncbi:TonB-dependent receptor [hydrothermal vent metagenome]|uniref:TonB-dependent receptor n=1 Tax=hydrothermal vent metagenome TaxID=652676 RepID=A0A3B0RXB2_9ZZZZ
MSKSVAKYMRQSGGSMACILLGCTALTPGIALAQEPQQAQNADVIVVTTQRREENILDVPYNISVVSGADIANSITLDAAELLRTIPGVSQIDQGQRNIQFNSIRIRGLNVDSSALGDFLLGSVPTVSTYVNETPVFANMALIDLDRVEVQRGPQATLYGSGALGGTVKYFTRKPQFDEVSGSFMGTTSAAQGSSSIGYSAGGVFNAPLSDTFAVRVNVLWQDYPGITDYKNLYVLDNNGVPTQPNGIFDGGADSAEYRTKKDADDYQSLYARISARWAPTDRVDIIASYFYQADDSGGRRQPSQGNDGFGVPYQKYENGAVIEEPADRNLNMGTLESNIDLGFATLTSATSYYENDGSSETDNTGFFANNLAQFYYSTYSVFPRPLYTAKRTFSDQSFVQELRLVSSGDNMFDYVVGAFYQDQKRGATQTSDLVGFEAWADAFFLADFVFTDNVFTFSRKEDYSEIAVFGELTANLSDRFKVTGGLRYFDNKSTTNTFVRAGLYTFFNGEADTTFTADDSKVLFRANAAYEFSDDDLLYATISEGYRRGGSNGVPTIGQFANNPAWLTFKSDTALNYEVGVKGTAGSLRYDLNAFYIDWNDPQFNTSTPNGFFFAVANADKARSQGIEAQISGGSADDRFNYSIGYAFVDAILTKDFIAPPGFGLTTGTQVASKGSPLPGVAKHSINVAADYTIPMPNGMNFISRFDGFYQSSTQNVLDQNVFQAASFNGFTIVDLTLTVAAEKWNASLFIKNVGNTAGTTGSFTPAAFGPNPSAEFFGSNARQFITLPRTFGLALNVNF